MSRPSASKALIMIRLPDLPNAGYSSWRQKEASDALMFFMRDCERDRTRLLNIVCQGPDKWRRVAGDIWRGLPIDTEAIDAVYRYFLLQACNQVELQAQLLVALHPFNELRWRELVKAAMPEIE